MFKVALTPPPVVALTYSQVLNAPNDFLYVTADGQGRAALGLMFIEQNQLKWISASKELIVTEQGRIVRTRGLANDLLYLSNTVADPLKLNTYTATPWLRTADWGQGEYGYNLQSTFETFPNQYLTFFNQQLAVTKVVETIHYANPANYLRLDASWQNTFWLDANTGVVLQSQQQLAPGMPTLELIFISEIARLLQRTGVTVAEDAI